MSRIKDRGPHAAWRVYYFKSLGCTDRDHGKTAMLMADNGADAQTRAAERLAALAILPLGGASKPAYAFYGDAVMEFATQFQQDINQLGGA